MPGIIRRPLSFSTQLKRTQLAPPSHRTQHAPFSPSSLNPSVLCRIVHRNHTHPPFTVPSTEPNPPNPPPPASTPRRNITKTPMRDSSCVCTWPLPRSSVNSDYEFGTYFESDGGTVVGSPGGSIRDVAVVSSVLREALTSRTFRRIVSRLDNNN